MVRKLKHHEQKLLRKVDFVTYKSDNNHRDAAVSRRYAVQRPGDYMKYNRICGSLRQLAHLLAALDPSDPVRHKHEALLLEKLYDMGFLGTAGGAGGRGKLSEVEKKITVSSMCRRRLGVVMTRLRMADTVQAAIKFIEQGHIRVGTEVITDPAFLVTRNMEDFVTWVDSRTQKAVVIQGPGKAELVSDRPLPQLRNGYILVKTVAVAINPTDWKHIDYRADAGALVGCDYSGTVEAVGNDVTKVWKKGDKVYGFVHGSSVIQHENGAFAEYIVAKSHLQSYMPESMGFEEAATLGVGVCTVGQVLYQSLKLPLPTEPAKEPLPLMIYGASTATGTLAIQFAKLFNLKVLTISSPKNFSLCTSLGADSTFDYNDPTCAEQIRDATADSLHYAFDCISLPPTPAICAAALSSKGGAYSSLIPIEKLPRDDIENKYTLAYTVTGETFQLGPTGSVVEGKAEEYAFAKKWWGISEKIFMEGKVKVHPVSVRKGGLGGVLEGLQEMREGKVSGENLFYRVAETA